MQYILQVDSNIVLTYDYIKSVWNYDYDYIITFHEITKYLKHFDLANKGHKGLNTTQKEEPHEVPRQQQRKYPRSGKNKIFKMKRKMPNIARMKKAKKS